MLTRRQIQTRLKIARVVLAGLTLVVNMSTCFVLFFKRELHAHNVTHNVTNGTL